MVKLDLATLQRLRLQSLQSIQGIRGCFITIHRALPPLNLRRVANLCLLLIILFASRTVDCQGKCLVTISNLLTTY